MNMKFSGSEKSSILNYWTVRTFLPLARLADKTFLPPAVAILARKPWTLAWDLFFGWYVIFIIVYLQFVFRKILRKQKTSWEILTKKALKVKGFHQRKDFTGFLTDFSTLLTVFSTFMAVFIVLSTFCLKPVDNCFLLLSQNPWFSLYFTGF